MSHKRQALLSLYSLVQIVYVFKHITPIKQDFQAYLSKPYLLTRVGYCIYYRHQEEKMYNDVGTFPNF